MDVHHLMGAALIVADGPVRHRKLHLVPVTPDALRPVDHGDRHLRPADPPQGVLHPLPLGLQLLGVVHVPELAPAARAVIGAVRLHPGRGRLRQPPDTPPGGVVADVLNEHLRPLAPEGPLHKHRHAVDPGHPLAAAGVALDDGGVNRPLLQHWEALPSALWSLCSSFFRRLENRSSSL